MTFAPGTLVRAREREWVVLPESEEDFLLLRPLGGTDEEVAGVHLGLEPVEPATFPPPDPAALGDHRSCRLLRDAVRLSSRAGAGPFRSFARIAVEPRPYQLVPLLMALRLDPVRLLIADDVGIGKTVEAALIARELLDRGEVRRTAVLCPPHLAEQWQAELSSKFHIEAELVLSSTAARLERGLPHGRSLFEHLPHVIVSTDFIKSDARRDDFVRACPELVIVDEAHTCAFGAVGRGRHQRHALVRALAADPDRHLILVTATPHSGDEEAFRSLLAFLDPEFSHLPADLTGPANERHRRRLAAHFVQRRRADIRQYLREDTPFPRRLEREETYRLGDEYRRLFLRVLAYAREKVRDESGGAHRQRVRWWSMLALLRALASSPAAAAQTLRNRAAVADTEDAEAADALGRRTVLDEEPDLVEEVPDVAPGADVAEGDDGAGSAARDRRLLAFAREVEKLTRERDAKLTAATKLIRELLQEGFHPIVFCRFIPTAEYVAEHLRAVLGEGTVVSAVTGHLPPAEREGRVEALGEARKEGKRIVLVCTDCLSEGINLQEHFDAVFHYDLVWNPTRHEQREGRVDRFGQPRDEVRVITFYGTDNAIDGLVLDVLLRKHKTIRSSLGISVPVPVDANQVVEAILEGLLLRGGRGETIDMAEVESSFAPSREALDARWEDAAERERRSRTMFAQQAIHTDEVERELLEARRATGGPEAVRRFTLEALRAHGGTVAGQDPEWRLELTRLPVALRDLCPGVPDRIRARFSPPAPEGVTVLARSHPLVEALAAFVMDGALDPRLEGVARRAGVIRTAAVARRTTVLLCRIRFQIETRRGSAGGGDGQRQIAEECLLLGFEGPPEDPAWLEPAAVEALLDAEPSGNVPPETARERIEQVLGALDPLRLDLEAAADARAEALLDAHRRVRQAARLRGVSYRVEAERPVDLLGIYVYVPDPRAGGRAA